MKYKDLGFRNLYHKYVQIPLNDRWCSLADNYPDGQNATHLLLYGYIDHTAGMSFSVICFVENRDGSKTYFDTNLHVHSFIRAEALENEEILLPEDQLLLAERYSQKISQLRIYDAVEDIKHLRKLETLDPYRHPFFPDDVLVHLMKDGLTTEACWVRAIYDAGEDEGFLGVLLNEPDQDFGWHKGDRVAFFLGRNSDGKTICYCNMNVDREYTAEELEDGSILKSAILAMHQEASQANYVNILLLLRDSLVWIPCNAIMAEEDEAALKRLAEEDPENLVGTEFTTKGQIRMVPDILKSGDDFYFPVFTAPAEMGEYGQHFSKVQKHFLEAIILAVNNERNVKGIVVNAFSDPFILTREVFDLVQTAKSRLKH